MHDFSPNSNFMPQLLPQLWDKLWSKLRPDVDPSPTLNIVPAATILAIIGVLAAFPTISSVSLRFLTFAHSHDFERIIRSFPSSVKALTLKRISILNGATPPIEHFI
ncbi:hypothetical protein B0H16DRAFT_1740944 [Mycena metata]|uniref:Uncharacterized protein n=1 Tax=Mycena metata TaxID=1033252 RepID=A0AAD7HCB8_9AGAR|nr:hypothetical protein B0H16DRAFT_1740944 [Mycena metata]